MKIIIILLLLSGCFYTSKAQDCINFTQFNLANWREWHVDPTTIQNDSQHGNYLQLTDDSGYSYVTSENQFSGNWLNKGVDGCFCFDYNVDWSAGNANTLPVKAPKIGLYTGTLPSLLQLPTKVRAKFVGNTSNPDLQNNVWKKFCLPIKLSVNGQLPSNAFGTWNMYNGSTQLYGAAAAAAWDNLIQNVSGIYLETDYNSFPGEKVRFDNFCWTCSTTVCGCSSYITFTEAPYVITPDGGKISAPSCNKSLGSTLTTNTAYQFGVGIQPYNAIGCTTEYSAVMTDANNQVIATKTSTNTAAVLNHTFSKPGDYCITYTLKVNGAVCNTCKTCVRVETEPNPCCKNTFPFWTDIAVPASYPFNLGTYSIEDFVVKGPNSIPITEIKVTVENFELISKYDDCVKCFNSPATLGSILGESTIGTGANKLTIETQPYGSGNQITANNNEVIWKNPNGVTLTTADRIRLIYILPAQSEIPCCVDSAKICVRFSYMDVDCGYCEVYNCTVVPLRPKGKATNLPTLQVLFQNSKGIYTPMKAPGF